IVAPTALFETTLDRAFVDVAYVDGANGIEKRESFELSAADTATRRFVVELLDPARRELEYQVTLLFRDGRVVEVPRSTTRGERVVVSADLRGHRTIQLRADAGAFGGAAGMASAVIHLDYEDATA